jgi:predicted pyridoxine 5'-phosphate oxidase superfamily flavin-nucleotide-binding protein
MPQGYRARPEQVVLFTVTAWDVNCPQHIPQRFEAAVAIQSRDERIAALESEVAHLRTLGRTSAP